MDGYKTKYQMQIRDMRMQSKSYSKRLTPKCNNEIVSKVDVEDETSERMSE